MVLLGSGQCAACGGMTRWISQRGHTVCITCHPPASPDLVVAIVDVTEGRVAPAIGTIQTSDLAAAVRRLNPDARLVRVEGTARRLRFVHATPQDDPRARLLATAERRGYPHLPYAPGRTVMGDPEGWQKFVIGHDDEEIRSAIASLVEDASTKEVRGTADVSTHIKGTT